MVSFKNIWFYEHKAEQDTKGSDGDGGEKLRAKIPEARCEETGESVTTPENRDVLAGRGRIFQEHPGNVRFRQFVEKKSDEYDALDRHDKLIFTIRLTQILRADNVRFLKKAAGGGTWVVLDSSEVRMKISQQFRTVRKKK